VNGVVSAPGSPAKSQSQKTRWQAVWPTVAQIGQGRRSGTMAKLSHRELLFCHRRDDVAETAVVLGPHAVSRSNGGVAHAVDRTPETPPDAVRNACGPGLVSTAVSTPRRLDVETGERGPATVGDGGPTRHQIHLQSARLIVVLPSELESARLVCLHVKRSVERWMRVPQPHQLEKAADDGSA
jgi:hypothetical protein